MSRESNIKRFKKAVKKCKGKKNYRSCMGKALRKKKRK